MDARLFGQLTFDKAGKNVQWKSSLFNEWCQENWTPTCRRMKLDHFLTPDTKINSKWMRDLNMRQETMKILEDNTGSNLFDLGHSNFLLDTTPKARETKAKMNYWDFIKMFIAALSTIAKSWKEPRCPSTDDWIKTQILTFVTKIN